MVDPDKMKQEERKLSDTLFQNPNSRCYENREKANKEAKRCLYCPGSKLLEDKERIIPPPSVLLRHWKRAVDICANIRDAKMGEMLFSKKTWKVHYATCKHIEKSCYSESQVLIIIISRQARLESCNSCASGVHQLLRVFTNTLLKSFLAFTLHLFLQHACLHYLCTNGTWIVQQKEVLFQMSMQIGTNMRILWTCSSLPHQFQEWNDCVKTF